MGVQEDFLKFTTEVGGEFPGGWLPTLDTALKVTPQNQVTFKFYEKPEGAKNTIHARTAMGENSKYQILSQEMVRRLMNTSNGLPDKEYWQITDNFADKLKNSGYNVEQIRRIVIAGAKGYGAKKLRSEQLGIPLRRTAEESQGARLKNKLVGKSTWFKNNKKNRKTTQENNN